MNDREWHEAGDNETYWRETDDPRVIDIVQRDTEMGGESAPWGDAYPPAAWISWSGGWRYTTAGECFEDNEAFDLVIRAFDTWGTHDPIADRYLRIFCGITYTSLTYDRGDIILLLNTPVWRDAVGVADTTTGVLDGPAQDWRDYLDGEVYGVGSGILEARVTTENPVDVDEFDIEIDCWGVYGLEYAKSQVHAYQEVRFLPPLLDGTEVH